MSQVDLTDYQDGFPVGEPLTPEDLQEYDFSEEAALGLAEKVRAWRDYEGASRNATQFTPDM